MLTLQFGDFGKGDSFYEEWREFLGNSIFVTGGEMWSRSRQLIRPMFTRERIVDMEIFEKHVQHLIPLLAGGSAPGASKVVDVAQLLYRYALDAATDYLLGHSTDSLKNPQAAFAEAFRYVQRRQAQLFRLGPISPTRSPSLPPNSITKLSTKETFLHALARFTRDPRVLRDQLVAVLLAGRDTTAGTLSFILFELGRNPHIVHKLREEIGSRLGLGATGRKPSYADLKEMKFLNAVINETMRFHTVVYSTLIMQRDPRHYVSPGSPNYFDPGKWIPERWVSGWQPKPWYFIPFNWGGADFYWAAVCDD